MQGEGPSGPRKGRGGAAAAVAVAALCLVGVAVIMPKVLVLGREGSGGGIVVPDTPSLARYLAIALGVVALVGAVMVQVFVRRGSYAMPLPTKRPVWSQIISVLLILWSLATLVAFLDGRGARNEQGSSENGRAPAGSAAPGDAPGSSRSLGIVVTAGLAILVLGSSGVLYALARVDRSRASRSDAMRRKVAERLASAALELEASDDPAASVIGCYLALESIFMQEGVPRSRADTADEFTRRALGMLDVPERSVTRLTELFARARFSQHTLDGGLREEARDALAECRAALSAPDQVPA